MGWSSANPELFNLAAFVGVVVFGTRKSFSATLLSNNCTGPVGQGSVGGGPKEATVLPKGGGTHSVLELLVTAMSRMSIHGRQIH